MAPKDFLNFPPGVFGKAGDGAAPREADQKFFAPLFFKKAAFLAAAAQAVEHYEISRYGTLIAMARELGHKEAIRPLQETLAEEKATDAKLTQIVESREFKKAA